MRDFFSSQKDGLRAMATTGVMGLHMVSGPAVGFAIGYGLDIWLDTTPWGGLAFLLVGIGAGFLNVWRDARAIIRKMDTSPVEAHKQKAGGHGEPDKGPR